VDRADAKQIYGENFMKTILILGSLIAALGAFPAYAASPAEDALESQASFIRLPSGTSPKLQASSCASCPTLRFEVTAASTYIVNGRPVSVEKLRLLLASDPALPVVVAYFPATLQLSRIIVTGAVRQ
jgi:hypothetical protein